MPRKFINGAVRGFTLIELLIVVIILAILAAIVIPQFSNSTKDAQEATMDANLAAMRSAIELYKVQHNGAYPGAAISSGGAACTGAVGTGAINTAQAFRDQLLAASQANGSTCTLADPAYRFGPYLRGTIPADPVTGSTAIVVTSAGTPITPGTVGGYAYDTRSGQLIINSTALDVQNRPYSSH